MTDISRRRFAALLPALPALAAPAAWGRRLTQPAELFRWRAVTPRVRACHGNGGNGLLVADGGECMVVDAKSFGFGGALRREAERLGGRPRWLALTHHHFDHAGGAAAFSGDVPTLGHANARARTERSARAYVADLQKLGAGYVEPHLRQMRTFTDVRVDDRLRAELEALGRDPSSIDVTRFGPTETVDGARTVRVGRVEVELRHVGPGHTDNDVFLFLPGENVLHTGDLLFHGQHPFVDVSAGATTTGWQRSLAAMRERCDARTAVVPGHGEVTDRRALETQRDYFDRLRDAVSTAVRAGRTRDEVTKLAPAGLTTLEWPDGLATNLGVVFDELRRG